jgi:hypothetical protein
LQPLKAFLNQHALKALHKYKRKQSKSNSLINFRIFSPQLRFNFTPSPIAVSNSPGMFLSPLHLPAIRRRQNILLLADFCFDCREMRGETENLIGIGARGMRA